MLDGIKGIPVKVFEEYEKVKGSGQCNMFDANCVLKMASQLNCYNLVNFVSKDNGEPDTKKYTTILVNHEKWAEYKDRLQEGTRC